MSILVIVKVNDNYKMGNSKISITISDIAAKLDVSKVTVSEAPRDHPDISYRRVKEVKEVAAKLGYILNIAARNLSAKKTRTIGVIVPVIANSFFSSITEAAYDCAFKNNYDIILAVSQEDSSKERKHLETMLSLRVDGIMIAAVGHSQNENLFNGIKASNIPLVFFDSTINDLKFSSVTLSNKKGAFNTVEKAINKGYRKIGQIGGWHDSSIGKERYLGYKEELEIGNIQLNEDFAKEAFHLLLKQIESVDVFIDEHIKINT